MKNKAQEKVDALKTRLEDKEDQSGSGLDLTMSAEPMRLGSRHPLSIVKNEIIDIFARLGFTISEGPEIEDDWHNFSALNLPDEHPARDMQDTFFIQRDPDFLLRTHTSSVQVRYMEKIKLPFELSLQVGSFETKLYQPEHIVFFIKSKGCMWMKMFLSRT